MPRPLSDLALPPPLAFAIVLATIALTIYAVDAYGRRARRTVRQRRRALASSFQRFLDGKLSPAALLRASNRADEGACWTVLELLTMRICPSEWRRLSRALEGSRHAAAERRALAADSPWRRVLAARRLALLRSRASWRVLRRAMARGPEMVTFAAAIALARYRDRGALRWILAHQEALAHRHRNALVTLLTSFRRTGLPVMAQALIRGGSLPRFELAIVDALGVGRYRDARPFLEHQLATGGLDLRTAAARALGLMQAVESAAPLAAALEDQAWQVRAQSARALGRVRGSLATPALALRLTDRSWWVRHHSAYALMEMGEDGQEALRQVIATSIDPYARDMAREALEGEIKRLIA